MQLNSNGNTIFILLRVKPISLENGNGTDTKWIFFPSGLFSREVSFVLMAISDSKHLNCLFFFSTNVCSVSAGQDFT